MQHPSLEGDEVILEPEDQKEDTGEEKEEEEEGLVEAPQTPGSEADGDMQHDGVEEEPAGVVIEELASDAEGEEGRPAEEDRPEEDEVVIIEEPGEAAVRDQPPEVVIVEELGPEEAVEPGEPAETEQLTEKEDLSAENPLEVRMEEEEEKKSAATAMSDIQQCAEAQSDPAATTTEEDMTGTKDDETAVEGPAGSLTRQQPRPGETSPDRLSVEASTETSGGEVEQQPRTSCPYGPSCYRRNPEHFQEEAHPGDPDYKDPMTEEEEAKEADGRPECEYGADCYRRNPEHRKQFKHTHRPGLRKPKVKKRLPR